MSHDKKETAIDRAGQTDADEAAWPLRHRPHSDYG
jgi:hypothetical protein